MNSALAAVLARPDIWRGDAIAVSPAPTFSSGFAELDAELPGGGWPRGHLTELLYEHSGIGEVSLLLPALARLTAAGGVVVLIAPAESASSDYGLPHAPAWAAAGVRLDHVYWVAPQKTRDCLWATVEALRGGAVSTTLLWMGRTTSLTANNVRRLQAAAHEGAASAFLYRPARDAEQSSPAPLRLRLAAQGDALQVDVLKRRGMPLRHSLRLTITRPASLRRVTHAVADTLPRVPGRPLTVVA